MNIHDGFLFGVTCLISFKSLLHHHNSKASVLGCSAFFMDQLSHPYMTTGKNHSSDYGKVMSAFNTLSSFVRALLPRSKHLLISWLQSPSTMILEPKKRKIFPFYLPWSDGTRYHDLSFWMPSFKLTFPVSSFTFIKRLYSLQPKMEKLYTVSKNKTRSWLWLRSWTPYCQIQTWIEESRENH